MLAVARQVGQTLPMRCAFKPSPHHSSNHSRKATFDVLCNKQQTQLKRRCTNNQPQQHGCGQKRVCRPQRERIESKEIRRCTAQDENT